MNCAYDGQQHSQQATEYMPLLSQEPMHSSEAAHAEAQARLLLRPPSPADSAGGGAGLLGVLDFRSFSAAGVAMHHGQLQIWAPVHKI